MTIAVDDVAEIVNEDVVELKAKVGYNVKDVGRHRVCRCKSADAMCIRLRHPRSR